MRGIGASSGIAIGKVFLYDPKRAVAQKRAITDADSEIERLNAARAEAKSQIKSLHAKALETIGQQEAMIFEAHLALTDDPVLFKNAVQIITTQNVNAEWALNEAIDKFIRMFEALDNKYIAERAVDLKDIRSRMLDILMDVKTQDISHIDELSIIVALDLLPSDTAKIDKGKVLGFVTELGAKLSHTAIIARSLEIPAVVGLSGAMANVKQGDLIILDGDTGEVILNPDKSTIDIYEKKKQEYFYFKNELKVFKGKPSMTKDGKRVHILANIGTPKDVDSCIENDAEGIGLFRTEFLYMDRQDIPSEDEQFEAYKEVVSRMQGKPVIIRTLDVGGDKDIPYLGLSKEDNPFLGYRAIRYCIDRQDIFKAQLRAILRASAYGHVKIMFPMIATLTELRRAKIILNEVRHDLKLENIAFDEKMEIGIMVEIPACAIAADLFAKESDFFSIGTNDLIQYTMAVDRGNSKVSALYSHFNPSVLRLVKYVIDSAHKNGIPVGMCGEAASDPALIPALVGMGLDDFSMNPSSVLRARSVVGKTTKDQAAKIAESLLSMATAEEVEEYLISAEDRIY